MGCGQLGIHSKSEKVCETAFPVKKMRKFVGPFWVFLGHFWSYLCQIAENLRKVQFFLQDRWGCDICFENVWVWGADDLRGVSSSTHKTERMSTRKKNSFPQSKLKILLRMAHELNPNVWLSANSKGHSSDV